MAKMIPSSPLGNNKGEIEVFNVLQKGGNDVTVWQSAQLVRYDEEKQKITSYEADFVVYTPKIGVIVLEVKNIDLNQLISGNYYETKSRTDFASADIYKKESRNDSNSQKDSAQNQANQYLSQLKGILKKLFGEKFPPHYCGVVLPSITRKEYEKSIKGVLAEETTLFKEDLDRVNSAARPDLELYKLLEERFNHHSNLLKNITTNVEEKLNDKFGKHLDSTKISNDWSCRDARMAAQDAQFFKYAVMLKPGRRFFFSGPAGSGKTVILANSACHLVKYFSKKVLFLCYNLSLVNYIKRVCCANSIHMGQNGMMVMPVFDLASSLSSLDTKDCTSSSSYHDLMNMAVESILEANSHRGKWDAVFVDEGQDFSEDMIRLISSLLTKDTIFAVAADHAQAMYTAGNSQKWKEIPNIEEVQLSTRYRSTREIMAFAHDWLAPAEFIEDAEDLGLVEGNFPESVVCASLADAATLAAKKCSTQREIGVALNQMCVLSAKKEASIYEKLIEELEAQGMLAVWPSFSEEAKKRYDITIDAVPVSTIHSMKGMDFVHVTLVLPLSLSEGRAESLLSTWNKAKRRASYNAARSITATPSHWRSVIYVGMTRARQSLTVIWYDDKV
ncbi:3'-5' exonuclease [Mailhella sp.]